MEIALTNAFVAPVIRVGFFDRKKIRQGGSLLVINGAVGFFTASLSFSKDVQDKIRQLI